MLNRPSKAAIAPVGLITAFLAAIVVSLWLLLPGGPLQAQDANSPIMYLENGDWYSGGIHGGWTLRGSR